MKKKDLKPVSDKDLAKVSGGGDATVDLNKAKKPGDSPSNVTGGVSGSLGNLMQNDDTPWDADGR